MEVRQPEHAEQLAGADLVETRGLDEAAAYVVDLLDRPASDVTVSEGQLGLDDDLIVDGRPDGFDLVPLSPADPGTLWAIDGGSSVLADGRTFQVVAYRAARIRYRGSATELVESPPLIVRAVSREGIEALVRASLAELPGADPEAVLDVPRPVDALREWSEWMEVGRTVRQAGRGDLVLVDGSLHGGPLVPPGTVRAVHEEAVKRGVHLAGVVKASTLFWGRHAPLVPLLKRRADREVGSVPWAARISVDPVFARLYVGDIYVAHLAPTGAHAFRVDVAGGTGPPEEILGRLAGASLDPAFVGYPYPLARAHQAARVTGYHVVDLRREFRQALTRRGMAEDDVEVLFQDFHEILNRS